MKKIVQKTPLISVAELKKRRKWFLVDAAGLTLGRFATAIAKILRGKEKPDFAPHLDGGDYVVVINAAKVKVTGQKNKQKKYFWHSGYPGGLKTVTFEKMLQKKPTAVIQEAVRGMLPKGAIGAKIITRLKVYADEKHLHSSNQPEVLKLKIK